MDKMSELICKHKKLILIISGLLLVLSFIGNYLTKINYDILVYLPKDIETIKGQDILTDDFDMGSYSVAVANNLSSKDLLDLEEKIKDVDGVNQVMSIYDAIGTVIPISMLPSEITEKLHKDNTDMLFITFYGSTSSEETIDAVKEIRNISEEKIKLGGMSSMVLDTMELSIKEILIYIVIAVILGVVIIYNLGILSYTEKQYQFATLKVLGFKNKQIKKIFIKQNNIIAIISIILGLPAGFYLTDWLFKTAIEESYDFGAHINIETYVIAAIGTFLISYLVSKLLAKKIKKIDMVTSLKGNE